MPTDRITEVLQRGQPVQGLEMAAALERIKGRLLTRASSRRRSGATLVAGRYRLGAELGRGGLGVVFRARDEALDRDVAIKVLQRSVYASADASDGDADLLDEARALAALAHPNIVSIFDHGVARLDGDASQIFIVMECVPGPSLAAWLAEPRPLADRLAAFEQAAEGLAAAHRHGLVHRDFKSENVLVDTERFPAPGSVKVTDFGLARALGDSTSVDGSGGTPAYMAPEQRARHRASPASDQFALCLAMMRALDGVDDRRVPAIRRVLRRGLRVDPRTRFPSIEAMLAALRRASRPRARRLGLTVGAGLALLTAGMLTTRTAASSAAQVGDAAPTEVEPGTARPEVDDAMGELGRGDELGAQGALERAHFAAALARDEDAAFETAATLGYLAGFMGLGDDATVDHWLAAAADLARSPLQRARVQHITATGALQDARYADAEAGFSRALSIYTGHADVEPELIVNSRVGLGIAQLHLGQPERARDTFAEALGTCEAAYGSDDQHCATAMTNLASAEHRLGRTREAIAIGERALAIRERRGADHPRVADALASIGTMWFSLGEYERAEDYHRRATEIFDSRLGTDSVHAATARYNLGLVFEMTDRPQDAVASFRRALEVFDAQLAADDPRRAAVVGSLGTMLSELGEHASAIPHLEEALSIHDARPTNPRTRASARFSLAKSLAATGRPAAQADALAVAAREDLVAGHAPDQHVALVDAWLAERRHPERADDAAG